MNVGAKVEAFLSGIVRRVRIFSRLNALELKAMSHHSCEKCGNVLDVRHGQIAWSPKEDGDYLVRCRWCQRTAEILKPGERAKKTTLKGMG